MSAKTCRFWMVAYALEKGVVFRLRERVFLLEKGKLGFCLADDCSCLGQDKQIDGSLKGSSDRMAT